MDEGIYGHRIHRCPFEKFQEIVKGEKKMTKTVLIVAAAAVFLVYGFVLWSLYQSGGGIRKRIYETGRKERKGAAM